MTEIELFTKRATLRHLMQGHLNWTNAALAQEVEMSEAWVSKWRSRLIDVEMSDSSVLWSQSRRPKTIHRKVTPELEAKVLAIRDDPPDGLQRTPGCEAIHYYLEKSAEVKAGELPLVCPKTINQILHKHNRIVKPLEREYEPLTRAAPMEAWAMDFKDVITVKSEETDKKMHQVETLNIVDSGTSILIDNPSRLDFNAETVIINLAATFQREGLPRLLTFDRDPRFVGSASGRDFPSPLVRFLRCLDIEPDICPPRQPFKNPFAERLNRTYKYEGILAYLPENLQQTEEMNANFRYHYNYQRPNQAITCGNRPPRSAFPDLPTLPPLPEVVDPDHWLDSLDGKSFIRRVNASGSVKLDKHHYYIRRDMKGKYVALQTCGERSRTIVAGERSLKVFYDNEEIKTIPLKGLHNQPMTFDAYLEVIRQEAISAWRSYLHKHRRYLPLVV